MDLELHTYQTGYVEKQPRPIFVKLDWMILAYPTLFVKHFWCQTLRNIESIVNHNFMRIVSFIKIWLNYTVNSHKRFWKHVKPLKIIYSRIQNGFHYLLSHNNMRWQVLYEIYICHWMNIKILWFSNSFTSWTINTLWT